MKWNKLGTDTIRWGFRALWDRIASLKGRRDERGANTEMHWVHSHVDDEMRRTQQTKGMVCACREHGEQECDAQHPHHEGNERADRLAKEGAFRDGDDTLATVAAGERVVVLGEVGGGAVCQGAYGAWMRDRIVTQSIKDAAAEGDTGERLRLWARGAIESDPKVRTAVVRSLQNMSGPSWRFWARAGLQTRAAHHESDGEVRKHRGTWEYICSSVLWAHRGNGHVCIVRAPRGNHNARHI